VSRDRKHQRRDSPVPACRHHSHREFIRFCRAELARLISSEAIALTPVTQTLVLQIFRMPDPLAPPMRIVLDTRDQAAAYWVRYEITRLCKQVLIFADPLIAES
jgi:hypothetical protein